jgi:hypothetical protein
MQAGILRLSRELHHQSSFGFHLSAAIHILGSLAPFTTRANRADIGSWLAFVSVGSFAG